MVPGIGPSADKVLHARMFSYLDSQRYRLGSSNLQFSPNRPLAPVYSPYERDGPGRIDGNYGADPNYQGRVTAPSTNLTDRDFEQPRELWRIMQHAGAANQFVDNFRSMLAGFKEKLSKQVFTYFGRVDRESGGDVGARLPEDFRCSLGNR
ncbi:hypothetical protein MBLNU13_g09265t1 [Cladosporium sp. NU13]